MVAVGKSRTGPGTGHRPSSRRTGPPSLGSGGARDQGRGSGPRVAGPRRRRREGPSSQHRSERRRGSGGQGPRRVTSSGRISRVSVTDDRGDGVRQPPRLGLRRRGGGSSRGSSPCHGGSADGETGRAAADSAPPGTRGRWAGRPSRRFRVDTGSARYGRLRGRFARQPRWRGPRTTRQPAATAGYNTGPGRTCRTWHRR